MDTNTASRYLQLSDNSRRVTGAGQERPHPHHPDRFDLWWPQLLCEAGLTGRCYWEVEWTGRVYISVSYRGIGRRGFSDACVFGWNHQSWSLCCSDDEDDGGGFSVWHDNKNKTISSSVSNRVAVYLDHPAGSLSFYSVADSLIHLHTFYTTFTEALHPGFTVLAGSSVSLC